MLVDAAQSGGPDFDMIAAVRRLAEDPVLATPILQIMRTLPVDRMLLSDILPREHLRAGLLPGGAEAGMVDGLNVRAHDLEDDRTTVLGISRVELRPLTARERARWLMLSAHVQSAMRLRRDLRQNGLLDASEPREDEAVLEPDGAVVHADGRAKESDSLAALRDAAKAADRARASASGRDHDALRSWRALVNGEWSLVDSFESDGRRYVIARKNPPRVRDPRGLSEREACVAAYVAQGLPNKLVAYQLGVTESTVSSQLTTTMRKLGLESRVELAQHFGRIALDPLDTED
jgi:DNA-binding CsgD family transcriptional regulator